MLNSTKTVLFALCLAALAGNASAQDYAERDIYQQATGDLSILYRGKQAVRYEFLYNGNPYWFSPEFGRGDIYYHGKLYKDVTINVDAHLQQALVAYSHTLVSVSTLRDEVLWFTMDGKRFDNLHSQGFTGMAEGYYELLASSDEGRLYKANFKRLASSVNDVNGNPIGYDDPGYRYDVYTYFSYEPEYYFLSASGQVFRIRNRKAILKQFPGRARQIREYISSRHIDRRPPLEQFCREAVEFAAQ